MRHRSWLIATVALWCAGSVSGQKLVGVSGSAGAPVFEISPSTGAVRVLEFAGAPEPEISGAGALDSHARRLFFTRGGVMTRAELVAYDLRDHHVSTATRWLGGLHDLVWDEKTQTLLTVSDWPIRIASVDVRTGEMKTLIHLAPNYSGIRPGVYAFDEEHRRLFFEIGNGDPDLLAIADLTTGTSSVVTLSGAGHLFFQYDQATGRLLTAGNDAFCRLEIRLIDTRNGSEESVATIPAAFEWASSQLSAFDAENRVLYYIAERTTGWRIVTFDVEARTFYSVPFPFEGNLAAFEFMAAAEKKPRGDAPTVP